MTPLELTRLADAYADGAIDDQGFAALQAALRTDSALRRTYLHTMRGHHQVRAVLQAASGHADVPRPRRFLGPGALALAAVVLAAVVVIVLRTPAQAQVVIVSSSGVAVLSSGEDRHAVSPGERVPSPARLRTDDGGTVRLDLAEGGHVMLASASTLERTPAGDLELVDGTARSSGQAGLGLAGTPIRIQGESVLQAAPWAVLLRLAPGARADLPGLVAGGMARRATGSPWRCQEGEAMTVIGSASIRSRCLDHYWRTGRLVVEDLVVEDRPTWVPSAAELVTRARELGGEVQGLTADGVVLSYPRADDEPLRHRLPLGRTAGGLVLRFDHRFSSDLRREARDGHRGNSFDFDLGLSHQPPFPDAPRSWSREVLEAPSGVVQASVEVRLLPVGTLDGVELSEVGVWADGKRFVSGWMHGDTLTITSAYRGGAMTIARLRIAPLWDTRPSPP